ncbi:MAG: alpha/beta hydrolase [Clostridia bacterium]|nr:alpha/beta hydrolase [Clostridia bacterium]
MLTMNNRVKDAKKFPLCAEQLERYTSVKQINRLFKLIMPLKFKTLYNLAPPSLKGTFKDLLGFLNGESNIIDYNDERVFPLWEEDEIPLFNGKVKPFIVPFLLKNKKAPAVLVVPGGSYLDVSMKEEGFDTARKLNEMGFHAIVLSYRVSPSRYPCMQLDIIRAIQLMRKNAESWGIIENQIIALGYSAGGHLVMSVCGLHDELRELSGDLKDYDGRPNALVSGYGMMDLKCNTLGITCDMIFLGEDFTEEKSKALNIHSLIDKSYPPVFMFSMIDDPLVPPKTNCMAVEPILKENKIPCEMHIYPGNRHGFNLGIGEEAEEWPEKMLEFLKKTKVI